MSNTDPKAMQKKPAYKRNNSTAGLFKAPTPYNQVKKTDRGGRPINANGKDGRVLLCKGCGSHRHFLQNCPDSHKKAGDTNVLVTEEINEGDIQDAEVERFFLYTRDQGEISRFTAEAINCAALDT